MRGRFQNLPRGRARTSFSPVYFNLDKTWAAESGEDHRVWLTTSHKRQNFQKVFQSLSAFPVVLCIVFKNLSDGRGAKCRFFYGFRVSFCMFLKQILWTYLQQHPNRSRLIESRSTYEKLDGGVARKEVRTMIIYAAAVLGFVIGLPGELFFWAVDSVEMSMKPGLCRPAEIGRAHV